MTITALPTPPSRLAPTTFSAQMDALLGALPMFVSEANALEQSLVLTNVTAVSTTSLTIGTGAKTLAVGTGKAFVAGTYLFVINSAAPANYMYGSVTSYSAGSLVMSISSVSGSGTASTWAIHPAGVPGTSSLSGGVAGQIPYQSAPGATSFAAAGVAGQTLICGGAGAPIWTSTPTVSTAALGDTSTLSASTAFVRNEGHFYGGHLIIGSGALTLVPASHLGKSLMFTSGSASTVWTLPAANAVIAGAVIRVHHIGGAVTLTINRAGSDTLFVNRTAVASITLRAGDVLELVSSGGSGWYAAHPIKWSTDWIPTLPAVAGWTSIAHGFSGSVPSKAAMMLQCTTSDAGFNVGDIIPAYYRVASQSYVTAAVVSAGSSNLVLQNGSDATAWWAPNKGSGAGTDLTAACWAYRLFADF